MPAKPEQEYKPVIKAQIEAIKHWQKRLFEIRLEKSRIYHIAKQKEIENGQAN